MRLQWSREHLEKTLCLLVFFAAYPGALLLFHPNALAAFPAAWQFRTLAHLLWAVACLGLVHYRTEGTAARFGWGAAAFAVILLTGWGGVMLGNFTNVGRDVLAANSLLIASFIGVCAIRLFPKAFQTPALVVLLAAIVLSQTYVRHEEELAPRQIASKQSPAKAEETAIRRLVRVSLSHEGVPYQYGAILSASGRLDCSAFVQRVFRLSGFDLSRSAWDQFQDERTLPVAKGAELEPGDLVFFSGFRGPDRVAHVGIYLGNHKFISALGEASRVVIERTDSERWTKAFLGARRYRFPVIPPEAKS